MSDQLQHQPQKKRQIPLSILALMVIFFLLFCFIFIWGISPVNEKGSISAPVHASTQAVYGVEDNRLIPRISKNIIRDVILDHNPYATAEIAQRMSNLLANLQTPVPEVTLSLKNQAIATSLALTESPCVYIHCISYSIFRTFTFSQSNNISNYCPDSAANCFAACFHTHVYAYPSTASARHSSCEEVSVL